MQEDLVELRVVGKITSDVELKTSASGTSWLSFTVESNCKGYKKFNRFMAFKEVADNLAKSAIKGNMIKILANVGLSKNKKTNIWETNITVYKFEMLKETENPSPQPAITPEPQKADVPHDDSDDLPF